jgi:transcriptional regulator with XRE-family HTH domain
MAATTPSEAPQEAPTVTSPLRLLRLQRKIPQERLASLSGLSRGWVGYLERNPGAMTTAAAEKLAAVLGVAAEELRP